ncbi:MAG: sensor domain-containing diguanylate cyclase [Nitrosomonas sp.]|nr:sensor domain-containing diguanylate cyclase [Nitrosomonas sp.]
MLHETINHFMPLQHPTKKMINVGFGLIVCIFALMVIISFTEIIALQKKARTITQTDIPTLYVSTSLENLVHQTLGSLRSWMLLKDEHFKDEFQDNWVKIRIAEAQMVQLSRNWNQSTDKFHLDTLHSILDNFEKAQLEILELVHQDGNLPANQLLAEKITPMLLLMTDRVIDLVDLEENKEVSLERKEFLIALFRFRHTLGKALAHIRSFMLTEKEHFIQDFNEAWQANQHYLDVLRTMSSLLSPDGRKIIEDLVRNRETLNVLTRTTFSIRQGEDYNRANYLLRTQVIEMNRQISGILNQMVVSHQRMLQHDNAVMADSIDDFKNKLLTTSLIAVLVTIWLGVRIYYKLSAVQITIDQRAVLIDQHIMIAYLDQNGHVKEMTNSLCRALDGVKSDFIGKPSFFFLPDGENDSRYMHISRIIQTGQTWEGEIEITHHNQEKIWLYSKVIPEAANLYGHGYTNILQDITDKKRIEALSITDKLTSLFNRRHFDNILEQQLKHAQRANTMIALCILDIDFFKNYNDCYGHQAGDHALTEVARALRQNLKRTNDFIFRLGGEEFGIIFSNMSAKQISDLLHQIQDSIIALAIKHECSQVHQYLTVSMGCKVCTHARDIQSDTLFLAADNALYQAKKSRSSIVIV